MGRRTALLIATYAYQDEGLRQLTAPGHDAEAFAEVLRDPDIAGFDVDILINEPHHRVGEALGEHFHNRRHDDLTLLYFTGHGLKDDEGRLHLAMANTRRDNLMFTSLPAEQIDRAMAGCMSRRQVLILDCCYSGAFPAAARLAKADGEVHTLERFQGRGRTVLTASDATQYSFEGDQVHGTAPQSVFTRHLVQGLREGTADLDGDGNITLDELYAYVHDKVVDEMPQQRPKKQDNVEGRIVIARNINWALPAHLRNALRSPIATDRLGAVESLAHLYRVGNETVRRRTAEELGRLADDDSRSVSSTAAAHLRDQPAPAAEDATPRPTPALATVVPPPAVPVAGEAVPPAPPRTPGTVRWSFPTGGCVQSVPTVVDGVVYVGSDSGVVYALDAATGREKWSRFLQVGAVRSAPKVDGNLVYVPANRKLFAIDIRSGRIDWESALSGPATATVGTAADCVYICSLNTLRVLHAADGTEAWARGGDGLPRYRWVVLAGQVAIIGNNSRHVYAIDGLSRKRKWRARVPAGPVSGPTALADGVLYVGSKHGDLHALDTLTGARIWLSSLGSPIQSSPAVADGTVFVGNDDARLFAVHAATGDWRWRFTADGPIRSTPIVAGTTVYFGSDDGNVYAVDTATGLERWRFPTGRPVRSSPAVADGLVYVGSDSEFLYAIEAAD
ncbi:PQQ-binding-like beta-propeller repeat protein [Streptomyces sp. NPDC050564]|uniref:caspase, EACC1-associated type n=1 Tax=Streptomyces sp. NPDC050564 TaxID=3365631 RepID=UPI0037BCF390